MFRVLIEGTEIVNIAEGLMELEETFQLYDQLDIYHTEINGPITLVGEDFEYLFSVFKESPCTTLDVEIQKKISGLSSYTTFFKGLVFVNDIEFNFIERTCQIEIVDNNLLARVINNADSKINMASVSTKNGMPISLPTITFNVVDFNGVQYLARTGHTIFDVLDYALKWMSDNTIKLTSNYLASDPEVTFYRISNEASVRTTQVTFPTMSFSDIWNDIRKLFNLKGFFRKNGLGYDFVVEKASYFDEYQGVRELESPGKIMVTSDRSKWISDVKLGSAQCLTNSPEDTNLWFPFPVVGAWLFYHNNKDNVTPPSTCNNETSLNLRLQKLITDNAIISTILNSTQKTEWDNEPILWHDEDNISCVSLFNVNGNRIFNLGVSNLEVLRRWQPEICIDGSLFGDCETIISYDVPLFPLGQNLSDAYIQDNVPFIGNYDLSTDECGLLAPGLPATFNIPAGHYTITINYDFLQYGGTNPNVFFAMRFVSGFWFPYGYTLLTLANTAPGWSGVSQVCDDMYDYVTMVGPGPGSTFTYNQTYDLFIPFDIQMGFVGGTSETNSVRLLPSSTVTIKKALAESFGFNDPCNKYAYAGNIQANINMDQMDLIKNSPFSDILVQGGYRNISGKIKRITRTASSGISTVDLTMRNT